MDFDPGFHEEMYDEGYEDEPNEQEESTEPEAEYDSMGNPILLAAAAGFGHQMGKEDLDEREVAEGILKERKGKQGEPVKVPLASRNEVKGHMTPFGRWATKVNKGRAKTDTPIEYTKEEQLQILNAELEEYFDD